MSKTVPCFEVVILDSRDKDSNEPESSLGVFFSLTKAQSAAHGWLVENPETIERMWIVDTDSKSTVEVIK